MNYSAPFIFWTAAKRKIGIYKGQWSVNLNYSELKIKCDLLEKDFR